MAAMRRRRMFATFGAVALAVSGNPSCAFVISHSRYNAFLRAPRGPLAVRQLHMATGSPRGRSSGGGVGIEGADGTTAVLTSSTTSPIQSLQSIDEYAEDERVAEGGASLGAEQGLEDFRDFTGQRGVIENSREATLSRKNSFLKSAIIAAAIGAGAWVAATNFLKRQSDLVNAYGDEMTYYVGDEKEMELCHKEYKGKLGPAMYRDSMYKEVIRSIGTKRAMTLDTVRSVKQIVKLFKFSTTKAVKLLVVAARATERSQTNVRSKLYFLGTLIAKGNNKAERILEPLRKNIESSFLADGEDMLKVRINNMAEGALKAAIEAVPDDQVLESGWEELGISDDRAAEIASALADEEGAPGGIDFYKTGGPGTNDEESDPEAAQMLKQLETDMEAKKEEPQDEKDPEPEGTPKAYECQVCGYKMFVAKGREFKFFGDDFKCPECGAGKNKFTEADIEDDLI